MATNDYTFDESAYLNYTGDNVWNAVYTIQLGELIENGIFDWDDDLINWADAAYSLEQYKRVCNYFIERFKFREISIVPYYEWGTRLHMKLVYELMPKYRMMYKFLDNRFDIAQEGSTETVSSLKAFTDAKRDLGNSRGLTSARELANVRAVSVARDLGNVATGNETRGLQSTRTIDENQDTGSVETIDTTSNSNTDTTGTENKKTDEYSKSREIGSGYPETLLSANADYVSTGTDKEGETVGTSDTNTVGNEKNITTGTSVKNFNENEKKLTTDKLTENEQTDTTDKLNETETTKTDDTDTEAENSRVEDIFNEAETTLTNNDSSTRATVLTRGNLLDSYLRYEKEYQNIDKQLLDELEVLFIGLYTMNTNAL